MPANTQTYGPIVAIFFEQLLQLVTHGGEPQKHECSITILMDEFANFPKMPSLVKGITFLRSYRIRVCAFVQYIAQLKDVYGEQGKESFLACPMQLAFNITSIEDARYFSALAGRETVRISNESIGKDMAMSVSMNTQHRDLLRPEEIMQLSQKKILVFKKGFEIIKMKKLTILFESKNAMQKRHGYLFIIKDLFCKIKAILTNGKLS